MRTEENSVLCNDDLVFLEFVVELFKIYNQNHERIHWGV